jgi:glycerol kinase
VAFDREASLAERTVAVIESIVFLLQVNIEALGMSGPSPCRLVVGGGLARLDGLCQRLSDLSGLPVERPEDVEATSLGVAWLLRRDPFSENGALASAPESQSPARFEPERHPALTARYAAWRALLARHAHG